MSYILEAIQKLEQKRRQEELPDILTLASTMTRHRKRPRWPYAAAGIVLLNGLTVFSILWINPWRHSEAPPRKPPASMPAETQQSQQIAPRTETPPPEPNNAGQSNASSLETRLNPKAVIPMPQKHSVLPSMPDKRSQETLPKMSKPARPKNQPMAMQSLPEILTKSLPGLKMTVHFYDDHPQSRFAIINNENLKEGQFLIPDLKLEQITPAGAILNYQGHKFLLGIN
jgi:general secretion pathway protein B